MATLAHKMAANMATSSSGSSSKTSDMQQQQQQKNIHLMPAPMIQPDYLLNNDRGLFKVYCFIKDFIGASGTSAVAIDNKIEQAMDLVKSHLMIAVREEVEVLKERISELMDKINKLELENNILKSNIPQETLQQLQMQLQIAGTQQPAAVGAPPATPAIQAPPAATAAVAVAAVAAGAGQAAVATVGAATSPATAAAPTTIPNGSAENGSSVIVDAVAAVEQQVQSAAAAAAAASGQTAPVNTNGPMS
ncbi:protein bunched, class 1/class 3/D/E isoforms isoform X7 [Drosophila pseudoobscura]|uniref:Protein bunched, class 1/class 3/D/E isoforms isoform X7 n=1 Tax=Drosophila pseudoobscura pseudoobscura TaxID=46245 RepID=A0A6I8VX55_DROPS|nr:protein bunched, class 1/class 3/D/E isoforms isoform X7 [Drosophila pseudoobscura]